GFRPCRPPLPSPSAGHQARLIPLFASLRCALAVAALTSSRRQGARPTIKPSKFKNHRRGSVTVWKYALHRYVLHHVPYIKEMHEAHHDDRRALIVTPVWLSLGSFAAFLVLPMWLVANPTVTIDGKAECAEEKRDAAGRDDQPLGHQSRQQLSGADAAGQREEAGAHPGRIGGRVVNRV